LCPRLPAGIRPLLGFLQHPLQLVQAAFQIILLTYTALDLHGPKLGVGDLVGDGGGGPAGAETEALRPAVEDYYRAAGSQDWDYTYDALDSETQALFTWEEWSEKNQWFADNAPGIYHIESVELDDTSQEPLAEVSVRLTGEGGSSSVRTTYFVYEDGSWKHRFGQEEKDLFEPVVPFEEWVDDQ
jgi:hypothetical protein